VHSAILIAFYSALPVTVGLVLTAALTRRPVRGFRFFRTALFLPQLIAGVVIAQAWTWIYDDNGPLNWALREVGLGSLARPWLGDFSWALPSIGAIGTWVTYGLCMVLFVSGVQKIPSTLYDAARVDGAGAVREFFAVTLPGLRGEVLVAFVLTTINALRSFDIVYNTTAGGPGGSTLVPSMYMYQNAFLYNKVGYAAAVATILAVTIFVLAAIVLRVGDRSERA
jgi:raffinose/stachyose/melibiose transport system permease protein